MCSVALHTAIVCLFIMKFPFIMQLLHNCTDWISPGLSKGKATLHGGGGVYTPAAVYACLWGIATELNKTCTVQTQRALYLMWHTHNALWQGYSTIVE